MAEEDIIHSIKKSIRYLRRKGAKPKKITMSRKTFCENVDTSPYLIAVNKGNHIEYEIFGLKIEMRDDMDPQTKMIVN